MNIHINSRIGYLHVKKTYRISSLHHLPLICPVNGCRQYLPLYRPAVDQEILHSPAAAADSRRRHITLYIHIGKAALDGNKPLSRFPAVHRANDLEKRAVTPGEKILPSVLYKPERYLRM